MQVFSVLSLMLNSLLIVLKKVRVSQEHENVCIIAPFLEVKLQRRPNLLVL